MDGFRHLDSPADSVKDRMTINKAVLMIGKAPVRDLMKKLHEKQEEIIPPSSLHFVPSTIKVY